MLRNVYIKFMYPVYMHTSHRMKNRIFSEKSSFAFGKTLSQFKIVISHQETLLPIQQSRLIFKFVNEQHIDLQLYLLCIVRRNAQMQKGRVDIRFQ